MKKTIKKFIILFIIFLLALAAYFLLSQRRGKNDVTYTAIEDADLPIVYMEMFGRQMNCLYGFVEDNSAAAGRDVLTVLPADRNLSVDFHDVLSKVQGIQYEIRSLDGERLVERTVLDKWTQDGDLVSAVLPIQNLLTKEEEYTMTLAIATENHPAVYYYTRLVWSDNGYIQQMIDTAEDFSSKTMDYEAAKALTTYLEADPAADNSSLGRVTLKNSFSQLTWRGMNMQREGEIFVNLKEMQGIMGTIQLNYVASRTKENGEKDYFDVSEAFTMKWNAQRIYMMDYDRKVNQIFSGEDGLYTDKRIMLGISDEKELSQISSASGKYKAFSVGKTLWCYDTEKESSVKVFSFRKSEEDLRATYNHHGIKILSVGDTGEVDFLVYGYMNRGNHEGTVGTAVYRYDSSGNTLTERMYLPSGEDYYSLSQDVEKLSFLNSGQVLYLYMENSVYSVDLSSGEYMVVANGLNEENFAVSSNSSRIAWQEGDALYDSVRLNVMDLKTGVKNEVNLSDGTIIRLEGFVGQDLVYGLAKPGEKLTAAGRTVGLPLYVLEIVGENMEVLTRYEKPGIFITDVDIRDSRVHLRKMTHSESGYTKTEEDTLVCNEQVAGPVLDGLGYLAAQEEGRMYFVQLDEADKKTTNIKLHVPKKVVAEEENVIVLKTDKTAKTKAYYAYSGGEMKGSFVSFETAVQAAYDGMGIVTDENGEVFWSRASRSTAKTVKEAAAWIPRTAHYMEDLRAGTDVSADGTRIVDARGCTLNQVLYFIFAGNPVLACLEDGSQVLIYGYDQYNISYMRSQEGVGIYTDKMGLNDAAAFFASSGENDFICFLSGKKE